jgi:P4 family phage/plasmid primase-like protien
VTDVRPDTLTAVEFLREKLPHSLWALTAIRPRKAEGEKAELITRTFNDGKIIAPKFESETGITADEWIQNHNGDKRWNVYFTPNPPRLPLNKKPEESDIREVLSFHVDIDPADGEAQDTGRARILHMLAHKLPPGVPTPSWIISSGGGCQAFWDLKEAIQLDGIRAVIADAKRYNVHLRDLLGADNCQSLDHLMRLPGTVNWPDYKKTAKGREPRLAEIAKRGRGVVYDLNQFTQAPEEAATAARAVDVSAPPVLSGIDDLAEWNLGDRLKKLIAEGEVAGEKKASRSEWLLDCVCNLIRANVPNRAIFSIITHEPFGIAASVLDKGSAAPRYAQRQIERAHEFVQRDVARPKLTDVGNGQRLARAFGDRLLYCYDKKTWLYYERGRWAEDGGARIDTLCKQVSAAMIQESAAALAKNGDDDDAKRLHVWAIKSASKERIVAMERMARSELPVDAAALDADPYALNVLNGTIDLRTGRLRPADPADLLCKQAPVPYEPAATAPEFEKFVREILPNDETRAYVQRALGYTLTGDTSEHAFFILFGRGSNGKTTFMNIVKAAMGDYAYTADMEAFIDSNNPNASREEKAQMPGKRLVMASEMQQGAPLNEQFIKNATGGEAIRGRALYQNSFEFTPQMKVFLYMNHLPRVRGTDHGMWRRIKALPFKTTIEEERKDKDLPKRVIKNELPGVLRWLVEGCLDWQRKGLGTCAEVTEATARYRRDQDVFALWFEDECTTDGALGDLRAPVGLVWSKYLDWCQRNGSRPLGKNEFQNRLADEYGTAAPWRFRGGKPVRCYAGFRLRDTTPPVAVSAQEEQGDFQEKVPF